MGAVAIYIEVHGVIKESMHHQSRDLDLAFLVK